MPQYLCTGLSETTGTKTTAGSRTKAGLKDLVLALLRAYRYFYATLQLGTPAKSFEVIVDTGSTITYVPCSQCGGQCGSHHAVRAIQQNGKQAYSSHA